MLTLFFTLPEAPDRQAFLEKLYRDYHKLMYWTARNYLEDEQELSDVVQDSLVALIRNSSKLQTLPPEELAAYIAAAVRNTAFNHRRQSRLRQARMPLAEPEQLAPLHGEDPFPERLEDRELLRALGRMMTPEERLLLEGKYLLELPDGQIARMLGCKPESLRTKLHRTRRNLRKYQQIIEGGNDHDHL